MPVNPYSSSPLSRSFNVSANAGSQNESSVKSHRSRSFSESSIDSIRESRLNAGNANVVELAPQGLHNHDIVAAPAAALQNQFVAAPAPAQQDPAFNPPLAFADFEVVLVVLEQVVHEDIQYNHLEGDNEEENRSSRCWLIIPAIITAAFIIFSYLALKDTPKT